MSNFDVTRTVNIYITQISYLHFTTNSLYKKIRLLTETACLMLCSFCLKILRHFCLFLKFIENCFFVLFNYFIYYLYYVYIRFSGKAG